MKISEQRKSYREVTVDSLKQQLLKLKEELMKLKFRHASGQLDNSAAIHNTRRSIARASSILSQRQTES